ncbi:hypothetical protein B0H14DRAFT_3482929 [Mycena olivaceomarginata]|nr:hypothetical protein B0H14DRAFT_3482929 [Mycena olivaceomarginata]
MARCPHTNTDHADPALTSKIEIPPPADLGTYQQQLADANSKGELLTFHRGQLGWHAHPYRPQGPALGPIKDELKEEEHELKEKPSTPTPLARIQDQGRPSHKHEIKREASLVKAEISGARLKRENALGEIPSSSSSPVAGASSSPIIIDDDVPSHFNSSPTPPPIPTAMGRPKPQRLNGRPRRSLVALTYTAAEAEANLHGDPTSERSSARASPRVLASRDFSRHLWLQEGTDGFPARLLAYSVGSPLVARITQAAVLAATPDGTHSDAATILRVAPVDTSAPYDDILRPSDIPSSSRAWAGSTRTLYRFHLHHWPRHSALQPEYEIWASRLTYGRRHDLRSFGGYCADLDVSAGDRFFVALGANEFAAIGPNNERTILTLD